MQNVKDTILDILMAMLLPLSLIGVWRFKMIKARYEA
jgi:hypothetical protein